MTTTQTIIGHWSVVEQQRRNRGEWSHEYDFAPGEWEINFHPNGRMSEYYHPEGVPRESNSGSWGQEFPSGLILFRFDGTPDHIDDTAIVFDPAADGPWVYFFEDVLHIRRSPGEIIAHHAHERHRLMLKARNNMQVAKRIKLSWPGWPRCGGWRRCRSSFGRGGLSVPVY